MLKILQARLQQYINCELPDVQAGFRKGRGNRDEITNICWIIKKAREFQKNICFFIDYTKAFDCVDHNKLWKILKEMVIPNHLTVSWETYRQDKKQQLELDMEKQTGSKSGKEYIKAVYCHPAYFNLYAEYIMRNTGLDETQDGIKIAGRNINNLRYAGNTTLIEESKDKLKSLLKKVKEESKTAGLKLNIKKTKITGNWSHHLMANRWGKNWNSDRLYFLGSLKEKLWQT